MSTLTIILFGIVVLATHFLMGITGFGSTVLALPFCILLVGVKASVPVLVVLAWLLSFMILVVDYKNLLWKEFIYIFIFVGLGLPLGMYIFNNLPEALLKIILALFMIGVAINGLYKSKKSLQNISTDNKPSHKSKLLTVFLFLGGIIHGAFGSGGPFIVIYAAKAIHNKSQFRATQCGLWLGLNTIIILKGYFSGQYTPENINLILWTSPFLILGMLFGNIAHNKVNTKHFTQIVYVVLLISGIFMFI